MENSFTLKFIDEKYQQRLNNLQIQPNGANFLFSKRLTTLYETVQYFRYFIYNLLQLIEAGNSNF